MAEAILKSKAIPGIEVKSAGVYANSGSQASQHASSVLNEKNIQHDHRSTQLSILEVNWAKYIVTMTEGHKGIILSQFPAAAGKTMTLKEFAGEVGDKDIGDPYGGPLELYRDTFHEIHKMIDKMIERLKTETN
jgi:protein-tyrosine phosphatase